MLSTDSRLNDSNLFLPETDYIVYKCQNFTQIKELETCLICIFKTRHIQMRNIIHEFFFLLNIQ